MDIKQQLSDELKHLMSFKSVTSNTKQSTKLLNYTNKELKDLGFLTKLVEYSGYSSLIAGTKSLTSSEILLQAHIDVVPAPDKLFSLNIKGDSLQGRGTYDMLFGAAVFLVLARKLHKNNLLKSVDLGIIFSSDEEIGGHNGVGKIFNDYTCNVCILPDAGGLDCLSLGGKGVLEIEIIVNGISGHASRPHECDNPIERLAEIIRLLKKSFPNNDQNKTSCALTKLIAGEALNQVPDTANLFVDIRYIPEDDPSVITKIVEQIALNNGATIKQLVCEPAYTCGVDTKIVKKFTEVHTKVTGRNMKYISAPGSSDARFMNIKNIPIIMNRPEGGGIHSPSEFISHSSLIEYFDVLEKYITTFVKK